MGLFIWERIKARRRGERIKKGVKVLRGRVFEKINPEKESSPDSVKAKSRPRASISAKVTRADGTVEYLGVISQGEVGDDGEIIPEIK